MSWLQLMEAIRSMSHAERLQPARFYESYQDDPAVLEVSLGYANADIVVPIDGEPPVVIKKGEAYLY